MKNHFIPGFLIGCLFGIIITYTMWYFGPKAVYQQVFKEDSEMILKLGKNLNACSAAYIKSHGGLLPKGTVVETNGSTITVLDYKP